MYVDDETLIAQRNNGMTKDELITRIVNIANSNEAGIVMEVDKCENHSDHQLPILDMKVWMKPAALNKRSELVEVHGTHMRS